MQVRLMGPLLQGAVPMPPIRGKLYLDTGDGLYEAFGLLSSMLLMEMLRVPIGLLPMLNIKVMAGGTMMFFELAPMPGGKV